jgi:uncharacterized protein with PQ loop repeat
MTLASIVGVAAAVVLLIEFLPQPLRILRTRSVSGVSTVGSGIAFVSEVGWLTFGIIENVNLVVATAVVTAVFTFVQLALVWSHRTATDALWIGLWAAVLVLAVLVGSLGPVLVVAVLVSFGPQVWTVWRSPSVRGVSAVRWMLGGVSGVLWGTYGLLVNQLTLVASGLVALVCAIAVLVRVVADRRLGGPDPDGVALDTPGGIR